MTRLILLVLSFLPYLLEAEADLKKEIILLHTNDIESVYEPIPALWRNDMKFIGGISHLATLIEDIRAKENVSFFGVVLLVLFFGLIKKIMSPLL